MTPLRVKICGRYPKCHLIIPSLWIYISVVYCPTPTVEWLSFLKREVLWSKELSIFSWFALWRVGSLYLGNCTKWVGCLDQYEDSKLYISIRIGLSCFGPLWCTEIAMGKIRCLTKNWLWERWCVLVCQRLPGCSLVTPISKLCRLKVSQVDSQYLSWLLRLVWLGGPLLASDRIFSTITVG